MRTYIHTTGIEVREELRSQFVDAQNDADLLFFKVAIQADQFVKSCTGKKSASRKADFEAVQKLLTGAEPSLVVFRGNNGQWVLIVHVPVEAGMRDKMVYNAAAPSLKLGLGLTSPESDDYYPADSSLCTEEDYATHLTQNTEGDMETDSEWVVNAAALEVPYSAMGDVKVMAMLTSEISLDDSAQKALTALSTGSLNTVSLLLAPSDLSVATVAKADTLKVADIPGLLPPKEPRFVLHMTEQTKGKKGQRLVLIYYCPDLAPARYRMLYSTSLATLLGLLAGSGLPTPQMLEVWDPQDVSVQSVIEGEVAPPTRTNKPFSKPKTKGKGKKRLNGRVGLFTNPDLAKKKVPSGPGSKKKKAPPPPVNPAKRKPSAAKPGPPPPSRARSSSKAPPPNRPRGGSKAPPPPPSSSPKTEVGAVNIGQTERKPTLKERLAARRAAASRQ